MRITGRPRDDHGDDRNLTLADLQAAAAGISLPQAIANIQACAPAKSRGETPVIRKSFPAVVTKADAATGEVEAFVNSTAITDLQSDAMDPGCWADVIQAAKAGEADFPAIVWGHDWLVTTGKVTDAEEVAPGDPRLPEKLARTGAGAVRIVGLYNLDTQRGREAFSDVKFGAVRQWSVGFIPDTASIRWEKGVRHIGKVLEWPEVSNVLVGASPGTATTATKATEPPLEPEQRKARAAERLKQARDLVATFKAEWSSAYIGKLPNSAFAYVEPNCDTKECRHFPHHDGDGNVDEAHVRNALARIPQSDVPDSAKESALAHVKTHAKDLGIEVSDDGKSYRTGDGAWVELKATTHSHYHFHPDGEAHSHKHSHAGDVVEHDGPATKVPHAHGHGESEDGKAVALAELKDGDVPGLPALPDDEAMHYGPLLQTLDGLKALIAQECSEPGYGEFGDIIALCCVGQDLLRWVRGEASEYGAMGSYSVWDLFDAGREALEAKAAGERPVVEPEPDPPAPTDLRVSFLGLSEDEIRAELHTAATEAANSSTQPNVPDTSGEQDGLSFERRRARPHPLRFGG